MFAFLLSPLVMGLVRYKVFGAVATCAKPQFFGLVPWYQYLDMDPTQGCKITNFNDGQNAQTVLGTHSPLLLIGLAIIDDLIRAAALVAVGFVIYGGITYATSQGSPDATSQAQGTIVNALIGLVIALIAVGFVTYIGNTLGALK